jgi:hypothetical protein
LCVFGSTKGIGNALNTVMPFLVATRRRSGSRRAALEAHVVQQAALGVVGVDVLDRRAVEGESGHDLRLGHDGGAVEALADAVDADRHDGEQDEG